MGADSNRRLPTIEFSTLPAELPETAGSAHHQPKLRIAYAFTAQGRWLAGGDPGMWWLYLSQHRSSTPRISSHLRITTAHSTTFLLQCVGYDSGDAFSRIRTSSSR